MPNLYISNILPPYRVDLCNVLHERLGCEICHFIGDPTDNCFSSEDIAGRSRFENRIVPVRMVLGKAVLKEPERLVGPDTRIVFVNEFSPIALQMLSLRRKYGFKVVSFCDDSMDMIGGNDFTSVHSLARRIVPGRMDEIILPTPEVADWYRARFGKGLVMPIIADDELMRERLGNAVPLSASYRTAYGLEGKPVVLFVGRLVGLKNLARLFEAYAPLREQARLVIVGDGEERAALEALSAALGLGALFVGARYGTELLAWYNLADFLVLPSTREAFGAVTGEALTCGCRVLVSAKAGSASLVRPEENGLIIDPLSTDAIREALEQMLAWPALERNREGLRPNLLPVSFAESIQNVWTGLSHIITQSSP